MKRFAKGVQRLSQRAAEIRQVVDALPARAAEFREVVHATAGQVQQLRGDLAAGVAALRPAAAGRAAVPGPDLDACVGPLAEAGFALEGADIDLTPARRVRVHLARTGDVSPARLRHLLAAHAQQPVIHALLAGIAQARDLAEATDAGTLEWTHLTVDVAGGQVVRLGWSAAAPAGAGAAADAARPPVFSQSSFFERRPAAAATATADAPAGIAASPAVVPPPPAPPPAHVAAPAARASALDRFKKMPDLTRRSSH